MMIWILLLYGLYVVSCYHTVVYDYHYIDITLTWTNARQFCRQHYTDLATFRSAEDLAKLNRPSRFTSSAWIGLFDDAASWKGVMGNDSNSWRWSATGNTSTSQFHNWMSGEPNYNSAAEKCVFMRAGTWFDAKCEHSFPFVCFTGLTEPGSKSYTLVLTSMSWEAAQSYCRQHHTDLAMIEDEAENTAVASIISSYTVWIGLYREPWRWSDGSNSKFTNWHPKRPSNTGGNQRCALENNEHIWNDRPCSDTHRFVCLQETTTKTNLVHMKLQSEADLSDPTVLNHLIKEIQLQLLKKGLTDLRVKWKSSPIKIPPEDVSPINHTLQETHACVTHILN